MPTAQDPPPPALAADVAMSAVNCQLATENICVATSNLLSLIRTLRLSILLMDEEMMDAEEEWQVQECRRSGRGQSKRTWCKAQDGLQPQDGIQSTSRG